MLSIRTLRGPGPIAFIVTAATALNSVAIAAPPVGILAHWDFDQTGATTATDSVSGFNGTLLGSAAMVAGGVSNGAVQLSVSTNDVVSMGNILPMVGTTPCTITAWVKFTGTTFCAVATRHVAGTLNGYFLGANPSVCYSSNAHAWWYRSATCGGETSSTSAVNDGLWHFLAATYHPNTGNRIYVDGGPLESSNGGNAVAANTANFLVGGIMFGATPTGVFTGLIDDVQVYGHALTCAEVNQLFQTPGIEIGPISPDLNGDGDVDGADLGILLATWGTPASDLNSDGITDGADLGILLGAWGSC